MMAAIATYFSGVWSGSEDPFWPHVLLLSASVLASVAVGLGILLERPKFGESVHRVAMWLVMIGVAIEAVCTICLFVFDERISGAQQSKIIALETKLAPRELTDEQALRVSKAVSLFPNTPFDVAVDEAREPRHFMGRILSILAAAHWNLKTWGGPPVGLVMPQPHGEDIAFLPLDGVQIAYDVSREQDFGPPAKALASALSAEGIPTISASIPNKHNFLNPAQIRLFIGAKP